MSQSPAIPSANGQIWMHRPEMDLKRKSIKHVHLDPNAPPPPIHYERQVDIHASSLRRRPARHRPPAQGGVGRPQQLMHPLPLQAIQLPDGGQGPAPISEPPHCPLPLKSHPCQVVHAATIAHVKNERKYQFLSPLGNCLLTGRDIYAIMQA